MITHPATGAAAAALAIATSATACLPGDTRPVPESVYTTAEPTEAVTAGIETSDGWRITFDRLVVGLGNVHLEDEDASCNSYAGAWYDRLFDFTVAGREKVGTVYGLGTCRIEFRLRSPSFDALLGPGASAEDVAFMRIEASDPYVAGERVSVMAIGEAARGGEVKRFDWRFRRSYDMFDCQAEGEGLSTRLELAEGGYSELRLEVRGEEFFRAAPEDDAALRFQPIADADADADGLVTLDELSASGSLGALLYNELLPRLVRVRGGGACEIEDRSRR